MLAEHPANLLLRFMLEMASLVVVGQWGWYVGAESPLAVRLLLAIGLPLVMAVLWAIFRTPGDASSANKPPVVAVPGKLRLLLELVFFGFALWSVFARGQAALGWGLAFALALHHIWSLSRLAWLWNQ